MLLSQPDINYAGVLPLTERRWARCCTELSRADVESTIEELADRGYVLVDYDTEELLIRSFMRNDGLWKQPKMLHAALRQALATASRHLRQGLARELGRLREALAMASEGPESGPKEDRRVEMISEAEKSLMGTPDEAMDNPLATPSAGPRAYARAAPTPTPTPTTLTDTSTGTESPATQSEGGSLDPYVRDSNDPPPHDDRPDDRCAEHAGTDHTGPCRPCGDARRAAERWDTDREKRDAAARRACRWCDADGWRVHPGALHLGPTNERCDHHTPPKDHHDD
ncbi:hypothetical protein [Pseudonocardia benzenivorans]